MSCANYFMLTVVCASLAVAGCTSSRASEEPHLEQVQVLLEQEGCDGYTEARQHLRHLDDHTRRILAERLVRDRNPAAVYLGCSVLVEQKCYDEAAPVMASLIVTGSLENELRSIIESDFRRSDNTATSAQMLTRVGRILIVNLETYQPEPRRRAEQFLVNALHLEVNKPFSREDAVTAVQKLSRGGSPGKV